MAFLRFTAKKSPNRIDAGTTITGDIHSENKWTISGNLTGDLIVMDDIIIEQSAVIKGNITGENVRIAGKVTGNIIAKSHLHLSSTSSIDGDITYQSIEIEDGAHYSGAMITEGSFVLLNDQYGALDRETWMKEPEAAPIKEQLTIKPPMEQPALMTKNKRVIIQ